jgi:hypothetical protein
VALLRRDVVPQRLSTMTPTQCADGQSSSERLLQRKAKTLVR